MTNRLRNQDDQFTDPEILAAKYKIGRSAFFEVELTMAERQAQADSFTSSSGALATAVGLEASRGSGGIRVGCPEINQYIWVNKDNGLKYITPVKAVSLLNSRRIYFLYNPISRQFNKLTKAILLTNMPLLKIITNRGISSLVSDSHKIIRNTADVKGQFLMNHVQGTEMLISKRILVGQYGHKAQYSIFQDFIKSFKKIGTGDCVEITLENEHIYGSSEDKNNMILTHNLKDEGAI